MSEIQVRPASDDDIPRILETLKAALGESPLLQRTPELWAWKHRVNPFGPSLTLVADAGGRIAAVRAMMRWELVTSDGDTLRCLRPVDTATHPDFLRRGLFRELTMSAVEQARSEGVDLVFNTPNERSAPGYLTMGWHMVARLGAMVRPRVGAALPAHSGSPPSIGALAPRLDPAAHFEIEDRSPRGLRTPRSEQYLRWRFASHPTASYGVLREGDTVLVARANSRGRRSELVLSDMLGEAKAVSIRRLARGHRARYLAGWFSPRSPERRAALFAGMLAVPKRTLRLVALPLTQFEIDLFDLASWDLATSDLELL